MLATQDSYLGDIREPLTRNLYTYAENNPINFDDPSGHGIWSSIKKGVSKVAKKVSSGVKSVYNGAKALYSGVKSFASKVKTGFNNFVSTATKKVTSAYNTIKSYIPKTGNPIQKAIGFTKNAASATVTRHLPHVKTAYEKAVEAGKSTYNWAASKSKEAMNIVKNWNKSLEKNMKHVCDSIKYAGDKIVNTLKDVDWKDIGNKTLDGLQTVVDVVGLIPGAGEIFDGVNALIYLGRGDMVNAGLSVGAMVPFAGWAATGGKIVSKVAKYGDEAVALGKTALKYGDEALEVVTDAAKSGGMKLDLQFFAKKANDATETASKKAGDVVEEVTQAESKQLVNGPYIKNGKPNGRPTLSGKKKLQFEKDVYNNNVDLDGILRDSNTGEVINWKPGQPRKNTVDFGHKSGYSYKEMFSKYSNGDIRLEELKEFQFSPDNYRLETPSANRSHKFE